MKTLNHQQQRQQLQAEAYQRLDNQAMQYVLDTPEGRWFLMRLLERSRIYQLSFASEAEGMAFHEGKRSVGQYYLAELTKTKDRLNAKQLAEREYFDQCQHIEELGD